MSTTSESSGPPLRALAMVLISLAILFAGLGLASLGSSDSEGSAPEPATEPAAAPATTSVTSAPFAATSARTTTAGATTTVSATTSPGTATAPVRVFNNSNVSGLAAQTAGLLEDEGFTVSETGNYSDGVIESTSVYYGTGPGERQTAEAVAEALGVTAQPRFAGIEDSAPGVIVIVTSP
ncbi:LytR C-terminal domain-containing protein [Rhodococcus ruber]|uniref:LytR C-terminal domain-containing protein n=1 Tax=Rhodococcus ruber TaxID=1830 RepID=UPI00065F7B10|nr:LytR C-terminal domain-containing protein [Rhodococcus ruber]MDO1479333.1 LytR C-terminal domain-containing protein [Rhodococcus ruber]